MRKWLELASLLLLDEVEGELLEIRGKFLTDVVRRNGLPYIFTAVRLVSSGFSLSCLRFFFGHVRVLNIILDVASSDMENPIFCFVNKIFPFHPH